MAKKAPAKNAKKPKQEIRGLEETARFFETTAPTVRSWLRDDCPVVEEGGNGRPYKFDLYAVANWRSERKAADAKHAEARAETDAQLRLELLGGDELPDNAGGGATSAKQRREILSAELDKVKLAEKRRELVNADAIRDRLVDTFSTIRDRLMSLPDQLGRALGLDDDQIAAGSELIEDILTDLADEAATVMDEKETKADAQAA